MQFSDFLFFWSCFTHNRGRILVEQNSICTGKCGGFLKKIVLATEASKFFVSVPRAFAPVCFPPPLLPTAIIFNKAIGRIRPLQSFRFGADHSFYRMVLCVLHNGKCDKENLPLFHVPGTRGRIKYKV